MDLANERGGIKEIPLSIDEYFESMKEFENSSDFIYRGQTNEIDYKIKHSSSIGASEPNEILTNGFNEWKIESSYNRDLRFEKIPFVSFLGQQLEDGLFDKYYGDYKFTLSNSLKGTDLLSKLYFLQHYGIPTCLIDFTKDPYVALYFAMSSLNSHSGNWYDSNGWPKDYPDDHQVSIYQINHKVLVEKLKVKEMDNQLGFNYYENYKFAVENDGIKKTVFFGIDTEPQEKINGLIGNYNLEKQKGAFVLYDNYNNDRYGRNRGYGLIDFISDYIVRNTIELDGPLVKIYRIKWNEFYKPKQSKHPNFKTVFQRLKEMERTGAFLFNDRQGLNYDLKFFYEG